jgi:transcriptional repressor NrdR
MRCPYCDANKDSLKVLDSRTCEDGRAIRRRRECLQCSKRFTTYERIEENVRLTVVKKDGSRAPWDRTKILKGLERACYKRPVPVDELQRIVDDVEEEIVKIHDKEVISSVIGALVTERLRRLDQVAYVRFASVYRQFKTLDELVDEARAVLDAQRFEDPGQGRLFLEEASRSGGNGSSGGRRSAARSSSPKPAARKSKPRSLHAKSAKEASAAKEGSPDQEGSPDKSDSEVPQSPARP